MRSSLHPQGRRHDIELELVELPHENGRLRPFGVAALEDKILQRAVVEVLDALVGAAGQPAPRRQRDLGPLAATRLRAAETWQRARRGGALYVGAIAVLLALAVGIALLLGAGVDLGTVGTAAKSIAAVAAGMGVRYAALSAVGRFLLWDSAAGAHVFEQPHRDPMESVADHFAWLAGLLLSMVAVAQSRPARPSAERWDSPGRIGPLLEASSHLEADLTVLRTSRPIAHRRTGFWSGLCDSLHARGHSGRAGRERPNRVHAVAAPHLWAGARRSSCLNCRDHGSVLLVVRSARGAWSRGAPHAAAAVLSASYTAPAPGCGARRLR